jgi:hypothetical protein
MMLANAPAVWAGKALVGRSNIKKTHWLAATLFLLVGVWSLSGGVTISLRFIIARARNASDTSAIYSGPRIP